MPLRGCTSEALIMSKLRGQAQWALDLWRRCFMLMCCFFGVMSRMSSDCRKVTNLDVMESGGHDALEQLVCGGIRGCTDEDARLGGHVWQAAHPKHHSHLHVIRLTTGMLLLTRGHCNSGMLGNCTGSRTAICQSGKQARQDTDVLHRSAVA